ncbi:MAG: nitrate reductase associated protein [Cyanobacteria bacterium J06642_2]
MSASSNPAYFQFEADFAKDWRCIPMSVRMKLDACGLKLKLMHWNQFDPSERQSLVEMPCSADKEVERYRQHVRQLAGARTDVPVKDLPVDSHPAWLNEEAVPESVLDKARSVGQAIALKQWQQLSPLQRFALIKLSRPSHENKNFVPALREFQLI